MSGKKILRTLIVCLLLCPLLVSCVDYDLAIRFDDQTHGEIVQTIHLSDRLLTLSNGLDESDRIPAFEQISTRARALSGKARRLDEDTLRITIPFYNGAQLVKKFNAFYNSPSNHESSVQTADSLSELPGAPEVQTHLFLSQQNFLFVLKNTLTYDLQINPAKTLSLGQGLNDTSWLNLNFHLQTPWGLVNEQPADWHLAPNQPHHIEAVFWVPSPVGIGAGAISVLCLLGYLLKHKLLNRSPDSGMMD